MGDNETLAIAIFIAIPVLAIAGGYFINKRNEENSVRIANYTGEHDQIENYSC